MTENPDVVCLGDGDATARALAQESRRLEEVLADRDRERGVLAEMQRRVESADARVRELEDGRDGVYRERAHLVALLARTTQGAVVAPAQDIDEPGWQIVYLPIGGRQCSWHIAPRDDGLFAHVEHVAADDPRALWDGHTTDEKYAWIASCAGSPMV